MSLDLIEKETADQINKIIEIFNEHLKKLQLGVIDRDLFGSVIVNDKGKKNLLQNLGVISVDNDQLIIKPNNPMLLKEIEKSVNNFKKDLPLKFIAKSEKTQLVLHFDLTITQEMRNIFVSLCNKKTEEFRVSLRNLRHDILKKIKTLIKNEEEFKRSTKNFQLKFDQANKILDDKEKLKINNLLQSH